jgi:hypothetical protein
MYKDNLADSDPYNRLFAMIVVVVEEDKQMDLFVE